jgi:rhodanese-related sulfurtransferase
MTRRSLLLLGACLPAAAGGQSGEVRITSADELRSLLAKEGRRLFLLDVREPQEIVNDGALAGSYNIPIKQVEARLGEIPRDKPVLVYCSQGIRAEWAADKLRRRGYRIRAFAGLQDWKAKRYPLVFPNATGKR